MQNHPYIAGLDGLRAFAIIFIVAYHFSFSWAIGGFLGVDIFFVLSGYLVTYKIILLQESELDFKLKKFWRERIQRLLPAVSAMIITIIVWIILFNRELLAALLGDAVSSIFYATNWWFIFHKLSYFDSFGRPSPLKHLWFLAVEEQFFFLWPIVLIMGLRYCKKREKFAFIVFICAVYSSLLMGILYNPEADPSRIYYGTDTRSFELLIGSLLAFVLPIKKLLSPKTSNKQKNMLNVTGIITIGVFILSAIFVHEYHAFLYRGGMLLFSINTAVLIIGVCQPSSFLGGILSWKPLRWIGTRSYEIYLWHYPIMVLSTPIHEIGNPAYWRVVLQLTITCIIAELSYRFIETPIRKLGFRGFHRKYLSFNIFKWRQLTFAKRISAVVAASVIVVFAIGITSLLTNRDNLENVNVYPTEIIVSSTEQAVFDNVFRASSSENNAANIDGKDEISPAENNTGSSDKKNEPNSTENNTVGYDNKNESNSPEKIERSSPEEIVTEFPSTNKAYKKILAIGDSIMLDIAPNLLNKYSNITIDGKVSRQMADAVKLAPAYAEFNNTDIAVIIELGTNGYFSDKQIDSLLDSFSRAHIYLINTRVPRAWEKQVNQALKEKAEARENVILIDWYSTAIEHPEYFGSDAVHLKDTGSEVLTNLISEALNSYLEASTGQSQ
jgi:peptidoglycan/LPS O-acetylase OafA/YrhL